MWKLKFFYKFFKSLPMTLAGPGGPPPCWEGPPPTPESCRAACTTAGSKAGPRWQRRHCKKWGLKINNNRILNLVSGPFTEAQILGTPILAIYKVTGLQFRSKFCPRGPALGHVKKFHPLLVKNLIKMNQEPAQSI